MKEVGFTALIRDYENTGGGTIRAAAVNARVKL